MKMSKISIGILIGLTSHVSAETQSDEYILDSITVHAASNSVQESIRAVQSTNAVTKQTIANMSSKNLPAAIRILPNVDVLGGPTPSNENISIRGLAQSHAYVSIDGIYQSNYATKRGSWYLNPNFVQAVQVTAGPTSGAAAGKITIDTLSAKNLLREGQNFGAKFDLGYRSNNAQKDYGLSVYGQSNTFDYLVAAQSSFRDPYEIGGVGGTYLETKGDQQSGLIKLSNQFDQDKHLKFTLNLDDSRTYQVRNDVGYRDTKYTGSSLVWTDKSSDNDLIDLTASVYVNRVDSFSWEEERGNAHGTQDIQDNSWGYNLSNDSLTDLGLIHFGTSGHFTSHTGEILKVDAITAQLIEDESASSEASSESRKIAGWLNLQLPVTDNLEVVPGIRYDSFHIKSSNAIGLNGQPLLRNGRTESRTSKSLNVLYYINDEIKLFASYAEALNAPGNGALFTSGRGFKPNPELKSERADNKEIGVVFDYQTIFSQGDSWTSRVSVFQNDVKDFITSIYSQEWPDGEKVNIGQAQFKGFELSTSYQINQLSLTASFGRTRGIDKNTGWYLPEMPSDKINIIANYQINDEWNWGTTTTFAFKHDKVPTQQVIEGGAIESIPPEGFSGWTAVDIYSNFTPKNNKNLTANISITNLFNRGYAQRMEYERNGTAKNPVEYYEEGRSFNLKLTYMF